MTPGHVHLSDKQLELDATPERISFRGTDFAVNAIDRVAYQQWIYRLNGAYMGTQFLVKLSQAGDSKSFQLDSKSKDERLDDFRAAWLGVVELLEAYVLPRLVERITMTIAGGGEHRFGSIVADQQGVRARRPLARTIPWTEVVGVGTNNIGHVQVKVRRGEKEKQKLLTGFDQWDVVLLPHVVAHFAGG